MRFVVCGEALIDLLPGTPVYGSQQSNWFALSGGGPMNTSVALSRLGADTQFLGRFGSDAFAAQLKNHLRASGVGLDLAVDTAEMTSLAIVNLDPEGHPNYTFHFAGTANFGWRNSDFPLLHSDDWLHFGSIGAVVEPGDEALAEFVSSTDATLSYDINVRPAVIPDLMVYWDRVSELMVAVGNSGGIVKASDEDIQFLVDDEESDVVEVAESWAQEYGLAMFVVTLGASGAVAVKADGRKIFVPGLPVEVVDTVGAGDTFMAGFLSAYVANPHDVEAALRQGIGASALVCTRAGANPPTKSELAAFLG